MVLTLYHCTPSPVSRAALLTARLVGADVNVKEMDLFNNEHLTPEYLKLNPQHYVPTLQDGDFVLTESRAIEGYLVGKYAKNDSLYPKDPRKRAVVDQRLYFDATTLFPRLRQITYPMLFEGVTSISSEKKASLDEALALVDRYLEGGQWLAGDTLTIADISCVASVSSAAEMGWDMSAFSNVTRWLARCRAEIPYYEEVNQVGATQLGAAIRRILGSA